LHPDSIGIQPKMLDPDPDSMNLGPKHCGICPPKNVGLPNFHGTMDIDNSFRQSPENIPFKCFFNPKLLLDPADMTSRIRLRNKSFRVSNTGSTLIFPKK
jgi:hypothetical protein